MEPVFKRAKEAGIRVIVHEQPGQKNADWDIELIQNKEFGEAHLEAFASAIGGEGKYILYVGGLTVTLHNVWADAAVALQKKKYPKMQLVGDRFGVSDSVEDSYKTTIDQMRAIQYYRYRGGTNYLRSLLPKLEAATAYHAARVDGNGLVVTNDPDYWQTTQNGEVTEYSVAYYELLQNMIWLEGRIGTAEKVTDYTNKANALRNAINARLFNSSAGLYVHTNSRTNIFPLDANMNAVRLGVAPADRVPAILSYFGSRWQPHGSQISQPSPSMADPSGHTIEPLNNTWEVMARFASEDTAGAIELLRRLWGVQVDPNSGYHTGTFWEFVNSQGLPSRGFDSLAHAWGAGPTQILTESVLGVIPVDARYVVWQVKPHPGSLAWAEGQVPVGTGSLAVRWAADSASQFHLQVVSPSGTSGEVWVPLLSGGGASTALSPGATLLRRSGNYDVYGVGPGTFEFSSTP